MPVLRKNVDKTIEKLFEVAKAERDAGRITRGQMLGLRLVRRRHPEALLEIAEETFIEGSEAPDMFTGAAAADGDPAGEIDWERFAAFLKEVLPEILKFIQGIINAFSRVQFAADFEALCEEGDA